MVQRLHIAALTLLLLLCGQGCLGTDDGPDPFRMCGNGTIEDREQCDDGFPPPTPSPDLSDNDDCLATCQLNVCGDEFLNRMGPQHIEVCDGRSLNNQTCVSQGFLAGTLGCASDCSGFDTSRCTPRPTPTPSPTATVTATPG
jgi:hypothetical protein